MEFGEIAFTIVGASVLFYKVHDIDADGIIDRGHRLQHMDPDKLKMDLGFIVGGALTSVLFISDAFQEFVGNNVLERMVCTPHCLVRYILTLGHNLGERIRVWWRHWFRLLRWRTALVEGFEQGAHFVSTLPKL